MAGQRVFTVDEINALLPRLNVVMATQMERRRAIEDRLRALASRTGALPSDLVVLASDTTDVAEAKRAIAEMVSEYEAGWRDVEAMGGVLKDPRLGLVDFYGRVDGELVWLCWKYGEASVDHF